MDPHLVEHLMSCQAGRLELSRAELSGPEATMGRESHIHTSIVMRRVEGPLKQHLGHMTQKLSTEANSN